MKKNTGVYNVKRIRQPGKNWGLSALIYGMILIIANIVMAIVFYLANEVFNDPKFTIIMRAPFILLYFVIGIAAISVGLYRMKTKNKHATTYKCSISIKDSTTTKEYDNCVVQFCEMGIVCGQHHYLLDSILGCIFVYIFGALFGLLICLIISGLRMIKVEVRIPHSDIESLSTDNSHIIIKTTNNITYTFTFKKNYNEALIRFTSINPSLVALSENSELSEKD